MSYNISHTHIQMNAYTYIHLGTYVHVYTETYVAGGFRVFKNDTKLLRLFHSGFLLRSWRSLFL